MIKLWKLNKITGYWMLVRETNEASSKVWLNIFQRDEPLEQFKLSKRRPS